MTGSGHPTSAQRASQRNGGTSRQSPVGEVNLNLRLEFAMSKEAHIYAPEPAVERALQKLAPHIEGALGAATGEPMLFFLFVGRASAQPPVSVAMSGDEDPQEMVASVGDWLVAIGAAQRANE